MVAWLAVARGKFENEIERHYSAEQAALHYYLGMKTETQRQDREASLTAYRLAQRLVG